MPEIGDIVRTRLYADNMRISITGRVREAYPQIWDGGAGVEIEFFNADEEEHILLTIAVSCLEKRGNEWVAK
jgi:hypothetical protein